MTAASLKRLGIESLRDLLFYKPASYQIKILEPDLSKLENGQFIQVNVTIQDIVVPSSKRAPIKILVGNDTGNLLLLFFNAIPPFIYSKLRIGSQHVISGKVNFFEHYFQISHPEFILNKKIDSSVEPIYPLTYGITNKQVLSYILDGLGAIGKKLNTDDELCEYLRELLHSLRKLHYADGLISDTDWNNNLILLAEKELFANQLNLAKARKHKKILTGRSFEPNIESQVRVMDKLAFKLTEAQKQVLSEIQKDQSKAFQMMRLLQGDVGSGKTIVALLSALNVVATGAQVAIMAPTELLANQHAQFFKKLLNDTDVVVELLTGKTKAKDRRALCAGLENGEIKILIGTHALFQEKVNFKDLAYIIVDEQHRFGVEQRLSLINKASNPDVLIMTATPIPRSLTLTVFGDIEVSRMTSKPLNRLPIITSVVKMDKSVKLIEAVNHKLERGEKIYWICPLIDQNDEIEGDSSSAKLTDVTTRFNSLETIYPGNVSFIHGRMSAELKEQIMQEFKLGLKNILVATTVIEVGIDIPEASLIVIENAEKFGLAQLHQLRGRVGRGNIQSHCILLYNLRNLSNYGKKRLEIMKNSEDGFYIAEQDMLLRGSGDILGTKQSGEPELFFADLKRDLELLIQANNQAKNFAENKFGDFQIKLFSRSKSEILKSC